MNIINKSPRLLTFLFFIFLGLCSSCATSTKQTKEEKQASIYYAHGTTLLIEGKYTVALDYLSKANQLRPDHSETLNNLGMAYYFKKKTNIAIQMIKRSLEIDPNNADAKVNLASLYYKIKNNKLAEKYYIQVTKNLTYQHNYRTFYNLGLIALDQKNFLKAENYFKQSVKVSDSYCPASYQLGLMAKKRYEFSSALKWFEKSQIGTCAKSPSPHYQEIKTLLELGKNNRALTKINFFLEKFPASPLAAVVSDHLRNIELTGNVFKSSKKAPEKGNNILNKYKAPKI